jgi:hypothetical protein
MLAPSSGQVEGGAELILRGSGFVDSGEIAVRFTLLLSAVAAAPTDDVVDGAANPNGFTALAAAAAAAARHGGPWAAWRREIAEVEVSARFVDQETLACSAPCVSHLFSEGAAAVQVSLLRPRHGASERVWTDDGCEFTFVGTAVASRCSFEGGGVCGGAAGKTCTTLPLPLPLP